jgi:hypothetical protein
MYPSPEKFPLTESADHEKHYNRIVSIEMSRLGYCKLLKSLSEILSIALVVQYCLLK